MDGGAVFGDHAIDEMQVAGHPSKLVEDPPGHQQHDDALRPRGGDRGANRGIQRISMGDGAVVVEREHGQFHGDLTPDRASGLPRWRRRVPVSVRGQRWRIPQCREFFGHPQPL